MATLYLKSWPQRHDGISSTIAVTKALKITFYKPADKRSNNCTKQHKVQKVNVKNLCCQKDKSMSAPFVFWSEVFRCMGRVCVCVRVQGWAAFWYLHGGQTSGWFLWIFPTSLMWFWLSIAPWKTPLPSGLTPKKVPMSSHCFKNASFQKHKCRRNSPYMYLWHALQEKFIGLTVHWRKSAEPT